MTRITIRLFAICALMTMNLSMLSQKKTITERRVVFRSASGVWTRESSKMFLSFQVYAESSQEKTGIKITLSFKSHDGQSSVSENAVQTLISQSLPEILNLIPGEGINGLIKSLSQPGHKVEEWIDLSADKVKPILEKLQTPPVKLSKDQLIQHSVKPIQMSKGGSKFGHFSFGVGLDKITDVPTNFAEFDLTPSKGLTISALDIQSLFAESVDFFALPAYEYSLAAYMINSGYSTKLRVEIPKKQVVAQGTLEGHTLRVEQVTKSSLTFQLRNGRSVTVLIEQIVADAEDNSGWIFNFKATGAKTIQDDLKATEIIDLILTLNPNLRFDQTVLEAWAARVNDIAVTEDIIATLDCTQSHKRSSSEIVNLLAQSPMFQNLLFGQKQQVKLPTVPPPFAFRGKISETLTLNAAISYNLESDQKTISFTFKLQIEDGENEVNASELPPKISPSELAAKISLLLKGREFPEIPGTWIDAFCTAATQKRGVELILLSSEENLAYQQILIQSSSKHLQYVSGLWLNQDALILANELFPGAFASDSKGRYFLLLTYDKSADRTTHGFNANVFAADFNKRIEIAQSAQQKKLSEEMENLRKMHATYFNNEILRIKETQKFTVTETHEEIRSLHTQKATASTQLRFEGGKAFVDDGPGLDYNAFVEWRTRNLKQFDSLGQNYLNSITKADFQVAEEEKAKQMGMTEQEFEKLVLANPNTLYIYRNSERQTIFCYDGKRFNEKQWEKECGKYGYNALGQKVTTETISLDWKLSGGILVINGEKMDADKYVKWRENFLAKYGDQAKELLDQLPTVSEVKESGYIYFVNGFQVTKEDYDLALSKHKEEPLERRYILDSHQSEYHYGTQTFDSDKWQAFTKQNTKKVEFSEFYKAWTRKAPPSIKLKDGSFTIDGKVYSWDEFVTYRQENYEEVKAVSEELANLRADVYWEKFVSTVYSLTVRVDGVDFTVKVPMANGKLFFEGKSWEIKELISMMEKRAAEKSEYYHTQTKTWRRFKFHKVEYTGDGEFLIDGKNMKTYLEFKNLFDQYKSEFSDQILRDYGQLSAEEFIRMRRIWTVVGHPELGAMTREELEAYKEERNRQKLTYKGVNISPDFFETLIRDNHLSNFFFLEDGVWHLKPISWVYDKPKYIINNEEISETQFEVFKIIAIENFGANSNSFTLKTTETTSYHIDDYKFEGPHGVAYKYKGNLYVNGKTVSKEQWSELVAPIRKRSPPSQHDKDFLNRFDNLRDMTKTLPWDDGVFYSYEELADKLKSSGYTATYDSATNKCTFSKKTTSNGRYSSHERNFSNCIPADPTRQKLRELI